MIKGTIEDMKSVEQARVRNMAMNLVEAAQELGLEITIERRSKQPPAMGSHDYQVDVFPSRKAKS